MLYLRGVNGLTSEQEAAIEAALAELGLRVGEVREAILVSLPDPDPDPDPEPVRRPWWRRWLSTGSAAPSGGKS